ncbi:VOC family protein [Kitasatospora purpeofusca]|uniref:VOC family protein n=1 Tax=Kitasatospora purpeofusca TaxID=67352 RepID=UPI00364A9D87
MNTPTTTAQAPAHQGLHHLELCVSDLERSSRWYGSVLGASRVAELDHRRPDGTLFSVVLDVPHLPGRLELRLDPAAARALADNELLTLAVEDRAAVDEWVAHHRGAHLAAFHAAAVGLLEGPPETELLNPCP